MNENDNTTYQSLWDVAQAIWGLALSAYIKNLKRYKFLNIMHLKGLKLRPKICIRKITKIIEKKLKWYKSSVK